MLTLKTLYKKQYLMFFNKYLSTRSQKIKSVMMLAAIVVFLAFIGNIFAMNLFDSAETGDVKALYTVALFFIILFFSIFQLVTSAQQLVANFYESPDIQYLLSMPIPIRSLLLFKLFNHTFKVVRSESLFAVPMILSISISAGVHPLFYVFLPMVYFLASSTATCFGIVFGILYLKRFSLKSYKFCMGAAQFISFAVFWMVFVSNRLSFDKIIESISHPFFMDYLVYLLPAYTGSLILSEFAFGLSRDIFINALLFLGVVTGILALTTWVTKSAFHRGLMNVTLAPQKTASKSKAKKIKIKNKNKSHLVALTIAHMRSIKLKPELIPGAIMMYVPYVVLIAVFSVGYFDRIELPVLSAYVILIAAGTFFISTGTEILMLPVQAMTDAQYEKNRFALLKLLPISPADYFLSRVLSSLIPSLTLMTIGIFITFFFKNIYWLHGLLIILVQALVYIGASIQSKSIAVMIHQKTTQSVNWMYNFISMVYSVFYYVLTFGLVLAYQSRDFLNWTWLNQLNGYLIGAIIVIYLMVQYVGFYVFGIKAWKNTEF